MRIGGRNKLNHGALCRNTNVIQLEIQDGYSCYGIGQQIFNSNSRLLVGGEDYDSGGGGGESNKRSCGEAFEAERSYIYVQSFGESWTARIWGVEPFLISHR